MTFVTICKVKMEDTSQLPDPKMSHAAFRYNLGTRNNLGGNSPTRLPSSEFRGETERSMRFRRHLVLVMSCGVRVCDVVIVEWSLGIEGPAHIHALDQSRGRDVNKHQCDENDLTWDGGGGA